MRIIDQSTWPRHQHFNLYRDWSSPHFNMCANVDITNFKSAVRQSGFSFTIGLIYLVARTANAIPEFRQRIRGDQVIEHEVVHPSSTIMAENDVFSFCAFTYSAAFPAFAAEAQKQIEQVRQNPWIKDDSDQDNQLFMTAIPWVSFTSFMHPLNTPVDSVPRFAWGKFFQDGERIKMPLSVQGHHALMDGFHVGLYYQMIQASLDAPDFL